MRRFNRLNAINLMMSLIEELSKELEKNPEIARRLARKLIEYIEPELSISVQIERLTGYLDRLAEEQTKIWQEIRALKEEQTKMREDFNRMILEIKEIKARQDRFERELTRMSESLMYGFSQLSKFAGMTFEQFVRTLLTDLFRKFGEIPEDAELKRMTLDGEEVDLFLEDPLVLGEVTAHAEPDEIEKLLRKARRAEKIYGRRARLILVAETAELSVARELRRRAREEGVELIIGKEL
ncbi:MAG: hypothetical protein NZ992_04855 [Candidatus Korarchaeum sp.]|nr:hypothetical protein [Candidatus Korarchaeum sp.]MDW8035254.1 hypothetical protein [Candidatus Korarchaeum sp.]